MEPPTQQSWADCYPAAAAAAKAEQTAAEDCGLSDEVHSESSVCASKKRSATPDSSETDTAELAERCRALDQARGCSARSERGNVWLEHVSTPWARDTPVEDILLEQEVHAFHHLVTLTPEERKVRSDCRFSLQEHIRGLWRGATAKVFGSFAYDTALFCSDMDIVVEGCNFAAASAHEVLQSLSASGYCVLSAAEASDHCAATVQFSGVVLDMVFLQVPQSELRRPVSMIKSLLDRYPAARPCISVLRWLLQQSQRASAAGGGGLGSYAMTLLVLGLCATLGPCHDAIRNPGTLLRETLRYYGWVFNYAEQTMTVQGAAARRHSGTGVSIDDPVFPGSNVAGPCTRPHALRAMMQCSSLALGKWERQIDEQINWAEYRGKTPLSSIISHKGLWERAQQVEVSVPLTPSFRSCTTPSVCMPTPTVSPSPCPTGTAF